MSFNGICSTSHSAEDSDDSFDNEPNATFNDCDLAISCHDVVTMTCSDMELSVNMDCDDDDYEPAASSSTCPLQTPDVLQSPDCESDTQLNSDNENDCSNNNVLCPSCGCVGDCQCQCMRPQTGATFTDCDLAISCHDIIIMSYSDMELSVNMGCDDDYEPAASSSTCPIQTPDTLPSPDCESDTQLDSDNENDCNNNLVLCPSCGCVGDCQCQCLIDDHNYASPAGPADRPTVRTHKRSGVKLTRKRNRHYSEWKATRNGLYHVFGGHSKSKGSAVLQSRSRSLSV